MVADHQDLCVLGGIVHPEDAEQFDDAADQAVEESATAGSVAEPVLPGQGGDRVNGPFRLGSV